MRAGYWGGLAAWLGFTLPSAILLAAFAYGAGALGGPIGTGVLHGLKFVAVAIVAQAVFGMARTLCPDRERASIAGVSALMILFSTSAIAQLATIVMGAIAGVLFCRAATSAARGTLSVPVSRRVGIIALSLFFLSLIGLPALSSFSRSIELFNAFYRSGALVFGGGHPRGRSRKSASAYAGLPSKCSKSTAPSCSLATQELSCITEYTSGDYAMGKPRQYNTLEQRGQPGT